MAKIEWVILCRRARRHHSGSLTLEHILAVIPAPRTPLHSTFHLAVKVIGAPREEVRVRVRPYDPDGRAGPRTETALALPEEGYQYSVFRFPRFPIPQEGTYAFNVDVNEAFAAAATVDVLGSPLGSFML